LLCVWQMQRKDFPWDKRRFLNHNRKSLAGFISQIAPGTWIMAESCSRSAKWRCKFRDGPSAECLTIMHWAIPESFCFDDNPVPWLLILQSKCYRPVISNTDEKITSISRLDDICNCLVL
jgi:hypothetical protein